MPPSAAAWRHDLRATESADLYRIPKRIKPVGEQGWELHMPYDDGLAVWDALRETGVLAVGVETYANSRRLEKSLRLQKAFKQLADLGLMQIQLL